MSRVFVYGASGYTGRLICRDLARRGLPFIAAGRSLEKLEAVCAAASLAGCQARVVPHEVGALALAMGGAEVVINASGPFSLLGQTVVEAALRAGCHYLDTTGEQDFMLEVRDRYGKAYARARKVLVCGNAWYFALGSAAVRTCQELAPELDRLRVYYLPRGDPTIASLKSLLRTARRPGFSLRDGQLVRNPQGKTGQAVLPGSADPVRTFLMPGGETVYFQSDPRLRDLEVHMVVEDRRRGVPTLFALWSHLSRVFGASLDAAGDALVGRFATQPPPEDLAATRFVVAAVGEAGPRRVSCVLHGSAPYLVTGFVCGEATQRLLARAELEHGFVSTADAFGARAILDALEPAGSSAVLSPAPGRQG